MSTYLLLGVFIRQISIIFISTIGDFYLPLSKFDVPIPNLKHLYRGVPQFFFFIPFVICSLKSIQKFWFLDNSEIAANLRHDCSIIVINDVSLSAQLLCLVKICSGGLTCICRQIIPYFYEKVKNKFKI